MFLQGDPGLQRWTRYVKCIIVLPCFNEEDSIQPLVQELDKVLGRSIPYKIVAVNDGSNDNTAKLLRNFSKKYPIQLLEHETNRGLAAALNTGLNYAVNVSNDKDLVVTLDADDTHDPRYIVDMIKASAHADIVIGSRYVKNGRQLSVPFHRVVLSKAVNSLIRKATRVPVRDATSGYRCFRASTLKKLSKSSPSSLIESKGFEASLELLVKAFFQHSTISEIPITLDYGKKKSRSKMKLLQTVRRYVFLLLKARMWAIEFEGKGGRRASPLL